MPLLHKIIRQVDGTGETRGLYSLSLKTEFVFPQKKFSGMPKKAGSSPVEIDSELLDQANLEAQAIIEQAETRAAEITAEARRRVETEAEEIKAAAAREGYEKGYREAQKQAENEGRQIRHEARKVLAQAEEARRQKLEHMKDEILALAVEIAQKIVARELETHPDTVLRIAEEAILLAAGRKQVVLWVNPSELEICLSRREQLAALLPPRVDLQIMTDEAVEMGGCLLENEYGRVDARLSTRWQNLLASLKGAE